MSYELDVSKLQTPEAIAAFLRTLVSGMPQEHYDALVERSPELADYFKQTDEQ